MDDSSNNTENEEVVGEMKAMKIVAEQSKCTGCMACENICPVQCISMEESHEGFLYPRINEHSCINCQKCKAVCPVQNAVPPKNNTGDTVYAAYAKNEHIVERSSSGGVFSVIAEWVLQNGGVVFGAAFINPREVRHIAVRESEELHRLCGSKYLQSIVGKTYVEVENELREGKLVLFSGTPCQVAGLQHYLQKHYENLICIDLICHSVPSPKAWNLFLDEIQSKNQSEVCDANFRDKCTGWEKYSLTLKLKDGRKLSFSGEDNLYMQAFIGGLLSRESCSNCIFKGNIRESDLTLGDYWGVRFVQPEIYHKQGMSTVFVNTEKGLNTLKNCEDAVKLIPTVKADILPHNPMYFRTTVVHPRQESFFKDVEEIGFHCAVQKNLPPTKIEQIKNGINRSLLVRALRKIKNISKRA